MQLYKVLEKGKGFRFLGVVHWGQANTLVKLVINKDYKLCLSRLNPVPYLSLVIMILLLFLGRERDHFPKQILRPVFSLSASDDKEPACNAGDLGLIPRSGRSPGKKNGYPLQYFCLENPVDRGAWQATVHGVTKSQTQLSN